MKRFLLLILCVMTLSGQSQQWVVTYPVEDGVVLVGGDCDGDGNYIVGACDNVDGSGYLDAYVMYVDRDGEFANKKIVFEGYKSHICSAICLEDGNAFVVGVKGGTLEDHDYDTLWIAVINRELDIVEEHDYPIEAPYRTWTTDVYLDFDNEGNVIVLADVSEQEYPNITNGVYAVFKCDTNGNILKSKYFTGGHGANGARPTGIIRVPDSDNMMLIGKGFYVSNCHSICYIDNELNKIATYPLPWLEDKRNYTDCWKDNGHFFMSSMTHHHGVVNNSYYVAVFEVDAEGHYVDTLVYDRADTSDYTAQYGSMSYISDDVIYIATYWESGNNETPSDAVICLIDSGLNLKGTIKLKIDNTKIRIMHCQNTSDGGCLVYGQCKESCGNEMVCVWKLLPEDFVVPWTLNEMPEASPHQQAYPNPTNDCLNIELNDVGCHRYKVMIVDGTGRKCFERRLECLGGLMTIDVSSLESGSYVYEVCVDGKVKHNGRFVKN